MNVNDQWMLEKMQQMAASMAASLPQASQNADTPEAGKGESFKDMMDKAVQDQKAEAPKSTETAQKPEKAETAQKTETVQKTEPRKAETVKNADGTETKTVKLTALEAAAVAAGYAALSPVQPDGTVWLAIAVGGNAPENNPLVNEILMKHAGVPMEYSFEATMTGNDGQWTLEASEDLVTVLEQFLKAAGDPRSLETVLDGLKHSEDGMLIQPKVVVPAPETERPEQAVRIERPERPEQAERSDDQDDANPDAKSADVSQPLFKDVKAAPVKVGENFRPLDTQQPDMEAKLAETIRDAARQGLRQIEIRLSPENLGALTIRLTQSADGTLQVVLRASTVKAADLLNQHTDGLNAALQGYGQNSEVRVEVRHSEDSQQAQQQQQQTDPNGHNRRQQEQRQPQEESRSGDFLQKLRLGLLEDM